MVNLIKPDAFGDVAFFESQREHLMPQFIKLNLNGGLGVCVESRQQLISRSFKSENVQLANLADPFISFQNGIGRNCWLSD